MYFSMYRIARDYPGIKMTLDRATYLERAYGTALGMFTVPMHVVGWSPYETGYYNERVIPQLIEELDLIGKHEEAAQLRMHWEKKVAFFVSGGPTYLVRSTPLTPPVLNRRKPSHDTRSIIPRHPALLQRLRRSSQ
jgi:hypothetical protein